MIFAATLEVFKPTSLTVSFIPSKCGFKNNKIMYACKTSYCSFLCKRVGIQLISTDKLFLLNIKMKYLIAMNTKGYFILTS